MNFKLIVTSMLFSMYLNAQTEKSCGFIYAQEKARKQIPDYDKKLKEIEVFNSSNFHNNLRLASATLTIPIVFHILHLNGSENISDAQIQNAVSILNTDYRKNNSDTNLIVQQFKLLASDCNVEFKLASIDPQGNCTTGITRHYNVKTDWTTDFQDYIYTWPNDKYLNVYIVRSMPNGAAGYTYLPGTVPPNIDAIVILHNYVGNIGTGSNFGCRSLTHEVGHWLGLSHVWGNTNNPGVACGDDGVNDTPITKGHSNCNLSNAIDCTPNVVENIQNYMEYSFCSKMFTIGQTNLMNGVLASTIANRINVTSPANLNATGIVNPNYNCAPKAEFSTPNLILCEAASIQFTDFSYNGSVTNWLWSSTGAQNTSTLQNGVLTFTNTGLTPVKLKVGNGFGNDSITKINFVTVLSPNGATLNATQSFENGSFPDNQWIASVPQLGSGFAQTTTVGATGQKSMYINNYYDNPNQPASLYTPEFSLNNVTGAQLYFKYAYAQQGNSSDTLRIYITSNCGATWTMIYNQSGSDLATIAPINSHAYVSPLATDWKSEMVSLSQFQGQSNVYLKFEFESDPTGPGNNFFIDDINLSGTVGLKTNEIVSQNIIISPNPAKELLLIKSSGAVIESIEILDITSKTVVSYANQNANEINVSLGSLAKGIYFVKVSSNEHTEFKKLIIE